MKRNFRTVIFAMASLLIVAMLALDGSRSSLPVAQAQSTSAPGIEGSWFFTVTPPQGGPPPFKALASFSRGGVFTSSTQSEQQLSSHRTTAQYGSWMRTGDSFTSTEYAFALDSAGNPIGLLEIHAQYQLSGNNQLEGKGSQAICDLNGENCFTFPGCARISGTRIQAEPPSCP
jgi:hypothetical protein